jgi:hypothetical protein
MRVVARLSAIALALAGLYWASANAWFFFSWGPGMAAFDGELPASRSDQVLAFLIYGGAPALLAIAVSAWVWRATRRPRRSFSVNPS